MLPKFIINFVKNIIATNSIPIINSIRMAYRKVL